MRTEAQLEKRREQRRRAYARNPESFRWKSLLYRVANRDKVREKDRRYRAANSEKIREKVRRWTADNPEKRREINRRWAAANRDKVREKNRRYRATNPEKMRQKGHRYRATNPDKVREKNRRYRAEHREKILAAARIKYAESPSHAAVLERRRDRRANAGQVRRRYRANRRSAEIAAVRYLVGHGVLPQGSRLTKDARRRAALSYMREAGLLPYKRTKHGTDNHPPAVGTAPRDADA